MKKIIAGVLILGFYFIGLAIASTVSTTDGQNFLVTNDIGVATNFTMTQISGKESQANTTVQSDLNIQQQESQTYLFDTEVLADWESVQGMAVNAQNQYQANQQTNQVNGT